jgi:hypothetical protein
MRRASFEGASKSLQTPFGTNALRRKTNAFRPKRREARACDTHIASLIESSDFFWDFRESRADYGVPIAEFFCGVIFKARIERWRSPLGDALSREAACLSPRGNHDATIHSQERFAGIATFPAFPPNPAAPLHLKPASATCGAKLLLRKVPQYMGHSAVCQVGCRTFLRRTFLQR